MNAGVPPCACVPNSDQPYKPIDGHIAVLDAAVGSCIFLIGGVVLRHKIGGLVFRAMKRTKLKKPPPTERPGVALVEMPRTQI